MGNAVKRRTIRAVRRTLRAIDLKLLLALPGIAMMLIGYALCRWLGLTLNDAPLEVTVFATLTAFFVASALSAFFEQRVPSFRLAGGALEGAVRQLQLTPLWAFALSLTSSVGEELFFRGFLLGLGLTFLPVWGAVFAQALLFAAFHPAPRAAWGYPLWTGLIGAWFGVVAVSSGSIVPGILAHYVFNHLNFNQLLEG
jgi:uncharacterized protein